MAVLEARGAYGHPRYLIGATGLSDTVAILPGGYARQMERAQLPGVRPVALRKFGSTESSLGSIPPIASSIRARIAGAYWSG